MNPSEMVRRLKSESLTGSHNIFAFTLKKSASAMGDLDANDFIDAKFGVDPKILLARWQA